MSSQQPSALRRGLSEREAKLSDTYYKLFVRAHKVKRSTRLPCANALIKGQCHSVDLHIKCHLPHSDHTDVWIRQGKPYCITTQPYSLSSEKLKDMLEFCEEWGLEFTVSGLSWHYPGWTSLVIFWAKGKRDPRE